MPIDVELGLRKPVSLLAHEALLSTYFTASCLRKKACSFLQPFGLTDVQFNLMMLLQHQSGTSEGITQARLSSMMLVNRANITSLIDRMEKTDLVTRTSAPSDRRYNVIVLTKHGKKLLSRIEPLYAQEVKKIMNVLEETEQRRLIEMLEQIRSNITDKI